MKHFCNSTFWKPACFFVVCSLYLREICESDRWLKITEEEFERTRNALLVPRGNACLSKLQAPNALLSERRTSKPGGGEPPQEPWFSGAVRTGTKQPRATSQQKLERA